MKLTQEEWRAGRLKLVTAMDEIMQLADEEERSLSDVEQEKFNTYAKEIKETDDKMRSQALLDEVSGPLDIPMPTRPKPSGADGGTPPTHSIPARARRHGSLRAFKGADGAERAYECGKWIMGGYYGDTDAGAAAKRWCRQRGMEWRVMTESSGSGGGYLVPEAMEAAIINLKEERGVARKECQVVPMATDTMLHPRRTSGVTINAIGETDSITASDAAVDQVMLVAKKWGGLTRFSTDLNEDSIIAFTDFLAQEFAYGFADKEDEALFNGDGTNTYHGIFGVLPKAIDGNHAGTVYNPGAGDLAFSDFANGDGESMAGQLPQYAAPNAKWFISRAGFYAAFQRVMDAAGGNTIDTLAGNSAVDSGGRPIQYLGFPVVVAQVLNATLTDQTETALFALGDMKQAAMLGDRRGITLKIDGSRYLEYDQMAAQATMRFDIVVSELGGASTAGSLIVYQTPGA